MFKRLIYKLLTKNSNKIILARYACLGNFVWERLKQQDYNYINHQKSRIDYILALAKNKNKVCKPEMVKNFLSNKEIYGFVQMQKRDFLKYDKKRIKLIFMDSYSELTDQLFEHKQGWSFLANYGDILDDENFKNNFISKGLLPVEQIGAYYAEFFNNLFRVYHNIAVIFLHYPTKLETREKFLERAQAIIKSADLAAEKYPVYSITVEDEFVDYAEWTDEENRKLPYHYHTKTYERFVEKIKNLDLI